MVSQNSPNGISGHILFKEFRKPNLLQSCFFSPVRGLPSPERTIQDGTLSRHKLAFVDQCTKLKCEVAEKNVNLLLTEREGRTGEYWPEVVTVRTERSEVRTKTTEGQYSPVRLEQARLVSSLLYGIISLAERTLVMRLASMLVSLKFSSG